MVCYNFISKFKISTNPGLSQSIFDQPSPSGWDGVQDQYGIIVLITLSCKPSAVVRSGKLLSSIKYNISVYSKLSQAKGRLLAFTGSLSSVILVTWRKFIVTSSIHVKKYGSFCLTFQCAFCEKDKHCITFDVVKDVTHKSCEGQDWKFKQCVGEQINIAKLLFYL